MRVVAYDEDINGHSTVRDAELALPTNDIDKEDGHWCKQHDLKN